jgi:hypothetical protein
MVILIGVIVILAFLVLIHSSLVEDARGPSQQPGGNPNAPGSYQKSLPKPPRHWEAPRPQSQSKTSMFTELAKVPQRKEGVGQQLASNATPPRSQASPPPPPPPPPPRPQVIYITDSDPTPPYGIPRIE